MELVSGQYNPANRLSRRQAILEAAIQVLNSQGAKGMTTAMIAQKAGLTAANVNYSFKRKEDLAAACLERGLDDYETMIRAAALGTTGVERLTILLDSFLTRHAAKPLGESPFPLLADIRSLGEPHHGVLSQRYGRMFASVRDLFDAPDLRWLDDFGRTIRAQILLEQLSWSITWLYRYNADDYSRVRDRMIEIFQNGFMADGQEWSPSVLSSDIVNGGKDRTGPRDLFYRAATRLINQRGYRGASVDGISAALNVTKGSFYHYLDSKDDLVVSCFTRTFGVMWTIFRKVRAEGGPQWWRLATAARAIVSYQISEEGPLMRATALSALPSQIRQEIVILWNRTTHHIASILSDGVADGTIRPVDPYIGSQMISAGINAAGDLVWLDPPLAVNPSAEDYIRPFLTGLLRQT